jgi:fatty-acyl-CoA synthase
MTMHATMMHMPMTTQLILRHGASIHAQSEVLTFDGQGFERASFADVAARAGRLAAALRAIGVQPGDRVATFCWNHQAHLEMYLAIPSMGAILHTLNVRLSAEQLAFIIADAADTVLIVDEVLAPLLCDVLPAAPTLRAVIVVGGEEVGAVGYGGQLYSYADLLSAHLPLTDWPLLDDTAAAACCYTSGTTGNPKGVVYSHRTIFVHSLASLGADTFALSQHDRILLLPPMFHANAWGLPFSGWFAGCDFILPGPHLQADKVRSQIESARPTFTATVPTLVGDLLRAHRADPIDMSSFRVLVSGGSAVGTALIDAVWQAWQLPLLQGWGMTETSPLCALSVPPRGTSPQNETWWRAASGRPVPGVEVRIVDDDGVAVPHDGRSVGALELRGPWIACGYHGLDAGETLSTDGWLRTGDVGTIDPLGYVRITDRLKDLIKSGGEWISSLTLEELLLRHPAVREAAVIAVPDPRWEERPLAVIVARQADAVLTPAELRAHLAPHVARFWLPEYWATVLDLPRTGVGKIDKKTLREWVDKGTMAYARDDG